MQVQIDFWQLLLAVCSLVIAFATVIWLFSNALVRQFEKRLDERFSAQEKRLDERFATQEVSRTEAQKNWENRFQSLEMLARATDREMLLMRGDLPNQYVKREDYIRNQTIIELKLDNIHKEQMQTNLRGATT